MILDIRSHNSADSDRFASWVLDDMQLLERLYRAWIAAFAFDTSAMDALYRCTDGIRSLKVSDRGSLLSTGIPKMPPALAFMTEHHTYTALSQCIRSASSAIATNRISASGIPFGAFNDQPPQCPQSWTATARQCLSRRDLPVRTP